MKVDGINYFSPRAGEQHYVGLRSVYNGIFDVPRESFYDAWDEGKNYENKVINEAWFVTRDLFTHTLPKNSMYGSIVEVDDHNTTLMRI